MTRMSVLGLMALNGMALRGALMAVALSAVLVTMLGGLAIHSIPYPASQVRQ